MQLTDLQKDKVRQWAAEGASLSQIQDRLAQEFDVRMSFIDVRLLVLDLQVSIKEKEKPADPLKSTPPPASQGYPPEESGIPDDPDESPDSPSPEDSATPSASALRVSVSRISQPGFALCGDVTFSDGTQAQWGISTHGELSLAGMPPDYRPTPSDVREFQIQLRQMLSGN